MSGFFVDNFVAQQTGTMSPSAPTVGAPNPFIDDPTRDIGFQKFLQPAGFTTAPNMAAGVSSGIATGGSDAPKFFSGDLGVDPVYDLVEDAFVSSPYTTNPFVAIGQAASKRNLKDIQQNIIAGEEGYGLGYFQGRLIGVRPGGQLSGVLPEGMTLEQQRELASNILATNQRRYQFDYDNPLMDTSSATGLNPSLSPSTQPAPEYTLPPAERPSRDPGGSSGPADTSSGSASAGYGGLGGQSGGPRATGGTVGFAEGGTTKKDPIQRTGFVEGPPQEYAKGTTVADTENLRVKEGSFVINAPMTEKLQKAGVLPKGNQKRKAANGGKMMEVALSKGEYVVEPKDVPKFGGYNFLEAVNDMGKPEVERRQAMSNGGEAGIDIPPLYRGFIQRPNFRSVPEGFVQQQKIDPGPVPPLKINNINIDDVQKVLTLVETRGYEDRNEGYFFTRSDSAGKESSAFGPLQITKKTLEAMKKDKFGQLDIEFKTNPDFKEYYDNLIIEGRNAVNVRKYGDIYEGPEGSSKRTNASEKEKAKYRGLGYGNIPLDEHKKYYPTLAALYMRYKAGMSKSEDDLVRRHFGNTASTKKYYAAKKELGIS